MGRSALPSTDPNAVWLADLIKATEAVAASDERCDPAVVNAFSHRLEMRPMFAVDQPACSYPAAD
jgi:hypothetical protein